jgi:hypothetical protein
MLARKKLSCPPAKNMPGPREPLDRKSKLMYYGVGQKFALPYRECSVVALFLYYSWAGGYDELAKTPFVSTSKLSSDGAIFHHHNPAVYRR